MKKSISGIIIGMFAGFLNCLFLLFAKDLDLAVFISTFISWVIIGFFINRTDFKFSNILKGIVVSLLISLPSLVYTIMSSLVGAIYTIVTTIIMGGFMGLLLDKINNR